MIGSVGIQRALAVEFGAMRAILGVLIAVFALIAIPHTAQAATCMNVRPVDVVTEQVNEAATFQVIVADSFVRALEVRGLEVANCQASLQTSTGQQALRDNVCSQAFAGDERDQLVLTQRFGVHPGLLCLAIEAQVGRWQGQKFSWSYRAE